MYAMWDRYVEIHKEEVGSSIVVGQPPNYGSVVDIVVSSVLLLAIT